MRYHIDTIPVWDAMKLEGECPLCALRRKLELGEVEGAMSSLSIAVAGILTVVVVPLISDML